MIALITVYLTAWLAVVLGHYGWAVACIASGGCIHRYTVPVLAFMLAVLPPLRCPRLYPEAYVHRCFVFEPSEDHIRQDSQHLKNLVMFPPGALVCAWCCPFPNMQVNTDACVAACTSVWFFC